MKKNNWKEKLFKQELINSKGIIGYTENEGCLIKSTLINLSDNNIWHNTVLGTRSSINFSTTNTETVIIKSILKNTFEKYNINKEMIICDAGGADGRITDFLIEEKFEKIILFDLDPKNIINFKKNLNLSYSDNILCLADDVNTLPFKDNSIDIIIAVSLFTSTNNFNKSLKSLSRTLKKGGIIINFEPTLESTLIYSLVRQDVKEFINILNTSTRATWWEDKKNRYSIYPQKTIDKFMNIKELKLMEKGGISVFPSLVFGGVLQNKQVTLNTKDKLFKDIINSQIDLSCYRQVMYISKKTANN